jgi:hypothetical protein
LSSTAVFFGDDWDDVLDGLPTLVKTHSIPDPEETLEQRRPQSGIWLKRDDAVDLAIPLVVRWIDPSVIIEEFWLEPRPTIPPENHTMDVLPWDVEVVEDSAALQEMLKPPSMYAPLPIFPVKMPSRPIPQAVLFAAAMLLGFGCAALGFLSVLALLG